MKIIRDNTIITVEVSSKEESGADMQGFFLLLNRCGYTVSVPGKDDEVFTNFFFFLENNYVGKFGSKGMTDGEWTRFYLELLDYFTEVEVLISSR